MPSATRRVSASQLQVVHAVEEYAASNSSLASWDQDDNAAGATSEPGAVVAMKDESNLETPVAQVPRSVAHHGQHAYQAGNFNDHSSQATPNGYFSEHSTTGPVHQGHQRPGSGHNMTVPERSKSLLSIISSAVSSVPISPASSNAGRSTPSTIHRMQRDFSNAKRSNLTDTQIPEEPTSAKDDQTPTTHDDDYDLYADHNGVVKDVRDGNGQPLRIASTPNIVPAELARTTTGASSIATAPDIQDSPGRRYSFDRPMSFVSGPQDDDGRPQDQINQAAPPLPFQSQQTSRHQPRASSGAIYSSFEPMQDTHWPPGEVSSQPPAPSAQQPVQDHPPAKVVRQPTRFIPHSRDDEEEQEEEEEDEVPAHQASKLPPQRTPPAIPNGQLPPSGPPQTYNLQDPRAAQIHQIQNRSVSAPLQHMAIPNQDHRVVSQPLVSPPAGPAAGPRNEFEYQQQMMQLQAKYPRFRGAESQGVTQQQPVLDQSGSPPPEKPASKPRLAAAIKGIVGRTSPNVPPPSNLPPSNMPPVQPSTLAPTVPPTEAGRAESFVSAVSNLSREPHTVGPTTQSGVTAGPQRPPSLGADSQYSHVSHGSTQVQPAQSRQDLSMPPIPPQFQSLHPQQPPQQQAQLALPQQGGYSQNHRASTGAMQDAGKKKRFSAFTGLFGKSNPAAELQGKFKLSREEKKAQKAQRHTSQPLPQPQPTQQWPPPNTQFIGPQQPDVLPGHGPAQNGQIIHPMDPRFGRSHGPPQMYPQGAAGIQHQQGQPQQAAPPQIQGQVQHGYPPQQQRPSMQAEEGSAYLRTKQLAEEQRARRAAGQPPRPVYENPNSVGLPRPSSEQPQQSSRQSFQRPPPSNGYYYPEKPPPEQGAYVSSHEEQQRALHLRQQQQLEAERHLNAGLPRSTGEQGAFGPSVAPSQQQQQPPSSEHGAYGASQAAHQQALQRRQESGFEQGAYGASQQERQGLRQQSKSPLPSPEAFGRSQIHYNQIQQHGPPQRTMVPPQHDLQLLPQNHQQGAMTRDEHIRQQEQELAHHRWQQQQIQLRQFHLQQQAQLAAQQQQQAANRSVSGPLLSQASAPASPVAQRHVSQPEPQYETPPIPGAYGHVQGVFVSPLDQPHAYSTPHLQFRRQESDPRMQPISPQVSAQSQMAADGRHHSDASSVSMVSPIAGPSPEPGKDAEQRYPRPRMPSIAEVHQQAPLQQAHPQQVAPPQQPWHMNFPPGTTEQDIVRARQKQFFQQQFASQQQAQAERLASSPSPRVSPDKQTPPFSAPLQQTEEQDGGFREVLPKTSPQPYEEPHTAPLERRSPQPPQQSPVHPHNGAGWPLNSPPGSTGPQYANAGPRPPSNGPHTPRQPADIDQRPAYVDDPRQTAFDQWRYEPTPPNDSQRLPPPAHQPQYDESMPDDEAPPSYDGPGVPNDGMEKSNPERPRPPNIITQPDDRGRQQDGRPRQSSLGLMQHPQPASMAASPQRTAPDMGAESLRRQMLQQEEHARMERIQRSQMQAAQRQREQQEREVARARAQELERSVSGGGRVGSLRSVRGSHNGGTPGWERRGLQGGHSRPVFELPAVEDDEPVMRATSFPGQEWVPPMYVDD